MSCRTGALCLLAPGRGRRTPTDANGSPCLLCDGVWKELEYHDAMMLDLEVGLLSVFCDIHHVANPEAVNVFSLSVVGG